MPVVRFIVQCYQTLNPASAGSYRQQKDQWAITSLQLHVYLFEGGPGHQSNGVFWELVKLIHLRRQLHHCHDLRIRLVLDKPRTVNLTNQKLFVSCYFHDHHHFESFRLCRNLMEVLLSRQCVSGDFQGWLSSLQIQLQLILVKP